MSDNRRSAAAEKITRRVIEHYPYALCFACLAAEHEIPECDVRQIAQVAIFREGFRLTRHVCYRCSIADEMLVPPEPTWPS